MSRALPDNAPTEERLGGLRQAYAGLDGPDLLRPLLGHVFAGEIALVSSFGAESAVLLHMVAGIDRSTPVLFVDTGMLFPETLAYRDALIGELGLTDVRTIRPLPAHERDFDPDGTLHGTHPEVCCFFRKVVPLRKALNPFSAWISGRKRHHGAERSELPTLERDGRHIKINPLVDWDGDALEAYRLEHDLPAHPLVAEGYASIGCRPCTTPVAPGEDPRAGRWRGRDKTECGIHFVDGKAVRSAA